MKEYVPLYAKERHLNGGVLPPGRGIRANHGGGYQYRLCPSTSVLTEACFKATPLAFVGRQYLQYKNGSREAIPSSYTFANGTGFHTEDYPGPGPEPPSFLAESPGLWARNPIPDHKMVPKHVLGEYEFAPPCHDNTCLLYTSPSPRDA